MKSKLLLLFSLLLVCFGLASCGQVTTANNNINKDTKLTVTFNLNYRGSSTIKAKIDPGQKVEKPTDPSREGFLFDAWYSDPQLTTQFDFNQTIQDNIMLYANWVLTAYDVVFKYNDNVTNDTKISVETNTPVRKPTDPTRTGYAFAGWYTDAELKNAYDFTKPVVNKLSLFAKWNKTDINVTFDLNYTVSSDVEKTTTVVVNSSNPLVKPTDPTRDNFEFLGWYTDRLGTEEFDFNNYTIEDDINLYAKWNRTHYNVTLYLNYDGSTPINSKAPVNGTLTLPEDPTRTGYTFDNWYTDSSCTTLFDRTTLITDDTSLYAKFNINKYQVSFSIGEGATGDFPTQTVDYNEKATAPRTNPQREDYSFNGWFTDETCTTRFSFNSSIISNLTLYAGWVETIVRYDVTFNLGYDGATPIEAQKVVENTRAIKPNDPERSGYEFGGWFKENTYTNEFNFALDTISRDTVLYAKWNMLYTISFNLGYEGASEIASQSLLAGASVTKPTDPTRSGYDFAGWFKENTYTNEYDYTTETVTANATIYAKWIRISTVTYNPNYEGAENLTATTSMGIAENKVLADRDKYAFQSWYLEAACTNEFDFTTVLDSDITLYAKWIQIGETEYDVTFNLGYEGAPAIDAQKVAENTRATKPTDPTRSGYEFGGWYKEALCTNAFDFNTDTITANTTIYAKWNKLYNVTFNLGYDGAPTIDTQNVVDGAKATKPTDPTRTGYDFAGWYKENTFTNEFNFNTEAITADTIIYAKWNQIYKVTYKYNYTDAPADIVEDAVNGKAQTKVLDDRGYFIFAGWSTNAEGTDSFDFNTVLTGNITLYAKWNDTTPQQQDTTIVFKLYYNTGELGQYLDDQTIEKGEFLTVADPSIDETYMFAGWYSDPECTQLFDLDSPQFEGANLYAKWRIRYTFEAEHVDLTGKLGQGSSSNTSEEGMLRNSYDIGHSEAETFDVLKASYPQLTEEIYQYLEKNVSNGYYLSDLYYKNAFFEWEIEADEEVENAVIVLRASTDYYNITLTDQDLLLVVNGEIDDDGNVVSGIVSHATIVLDHAMDQDLGGLGDNHKRQFMNYTLTTTLHLKKGINTVRFQINNTRDHGGTYNAEAPMVDCIYIYSDVELSYEPILDFIEKGHEKGLFNEG